MVLIVSEQFEMSTAEVMEWIDELGEKSVRINGDEFFDERRFKHQLALTSDDEQVLNINKDDQKISFDEIDYVWFRRDEKPPPPSFLYAIKDKELRSQMKTHIYMEIIRAKEFIYEALQNKPHIGNPIDRRMSKYAGLLLAKKSGLDIPATILTDDKSYLIAFKNKFKHIITKAISDSDFFEPSDGAVFSAYTSEIDDATIDDTSNNFCVTLAQEKLEKDIELRVFYLCGKCYSMAIFSQLDPQTSVDFRRYNYDKPNRYVPYQLHVELERKIDVFMQDIGLNTGSLDFVKTQDGRFVFLEVNPVGQFGMVSKPCNYNLEKIIASYLSNKTSPNT